MNHSWYGDNRDIVKWAALLYLAREHSLSTIYQVAFLRNAQPSRTLRVNNRTVPIDPRVWSHFKSCSNVSALVTGGSPKIIVEDSEFDPAQRSLYIEQALQKARLLAGPKAVLLDPDTGIAPARPNATHVLEAELARTWESLRPGDCLVMYQHARRTKSWRNDVLRQFSRVVTPCQVHRFDSADLARDVALYSAAKS